MTNTAITAIIIVACEHGSMSCKKTIFTLVQSCSDRVTRDMLKVHEVHAATGLLAFIQAYMTAARRIKVEMRNTAITMSRMLLRGVKDWVHMKTAKMMQDFNWLCNLDVNHKLFLTFIIKVVCLCTLHNKIISPAHFVVYVLWRPTPTWFSNINA